MVWFFFTKETNKEGTRICFYKFGRLNQENEFAVFGWSWGSSSWSWRWYIGTCAEENMDSP